MVLKYLILGKLLLILATMNKFFGEISKYIKKYKLYVLRDVVFFVIITLTIHFAYRYWANTAHYRPIEKQMNLAQKGRLDSL